MDAAVDKFLIQFGSSVEQNTFVKMTLGKARNKSQNLKNIYVRLVEIKNEEKLSFTYRYKNRDEVKNYGIAEARLELEKFLGSEMMHAHLFTTKSNLSLSINKKGKGHLITGNPTLSQVEDKQHDRSKKRFVNKSALYLKELGVTDQKGEVRPKMIDKYKQINKYIELLNPILQSQKNKKKLKIVDMGAGKGYLTFALYDYLKTEVGIEVEITGVEQREELVDFCNKLAAENGFTGLHFEKGSIEKFNFKKLDVLIALHACDTATDDAIFHGIKSDASVIVCAPCCHKQIRQQMKPDVEQLPFLKYGILMERQAEMLTDTIRALIMEQMGYESKIFEFISNEHTAKNLMIVGQKSNKEIDKAQIQDKIDSLKNRYGIEYHYLEKRILND